MLKFASSWKALAALGLIAAFAASIAWPNVERASADISNVTPSLVAFSSGSTQQVTITAQDDDGDLVVSTSSGTLATVSCGVTGADDCGTITGSGTASITVADDVGDTTPQTLTLVVNLSATCTEPGAVTITATQDGDSTPTATLYCVDDVDEPQFVAEKDADDNADYDFSWDASGGDCLIWRADDTFELDDDGLFELSDNDQAGFFCEDSVRLTVREDDEGNFAFIDDCDEGDEGVDDISGSEVEIDVSDVDSGDTVFCVWVNDEDFTVAPTTTTGQAATVSIVLTTGQISCGGSTLVQVIPRSSSGGPAAAGTTILLTSSLGGSFQPASSVTSLFPVSLANFLYTAPENISGTTSITARAGNVQTTTVLQIVCGVAPTPVSTAAPLSPPSAGDGGLLGGSSNAGYLPAALAIAAAAAVLGLTAATRRFAVAPADVDGISLPGPATSTRQPGGLALLVSFVMLAVALLARRWR